jgi:hypothetical protein
VKSIGAAWLRRSGVHTPRVLGGYPLTIPNTRSDTLSRRVFMKDENETLYSHSLVSLAGSTCFWERIITST